MKEVAFIKNENGWALPTVLMVMLVVTLLGTALWQYSVAENLQVTKNEKQMQARYLARAGVEAVRDAWLDSSLGNKPTGKVETVYLMLDGTFQKESALSKEQIKSQTIGHVSATVSHDKGEWTITSIGEVDSVSQTVNATSTPLVYGHELEPPWYNEEDDNILPGPNTQTLSDFDENLMYHDEVRGVALVESKNTLQMQNDNDNNKVAYIAQHLFFQSAVDLRLYTDWWWVVPIDTYQGFMVASAETVVFNDRLDVRVGILSLSYGVLVLHVPEGLGVPGEKVRAAPG
ncbi:MAG: hypothetical protein MJA84_04885, partial [Firmicutes bacterium]|nr:hypothetical protein [Bacillota bacterium]